MKSEPVEIVCTVDVKPGEKLALPLSLVDGIGPGRWVVSVRPAEGSEIRQHGAFLTSYAPKDEGLYDDFPR